MITRKKQISILLTIIILVFLGLFNIQKGEIAFGVSLMSASIGIGIMRFIKEKRVAELKSKGLNPHDERTTYIAGLASILTVNVTIFLMAVIILIGTILGPTTLVNPYNLLGFCLAGIVLIYIIAFYYYRRKN